jgi:hypothetical protein
MFNIKPKKSEVAAEVFNNIDTVITDFRTVLTNVDTLIADRNLQLVQLQADVEAAIQRLNDARAEIVKAEKIKKNISELIED